MELGGLGEALVKAWPALPPHGDAVAALQEAVTEGWKLAVLTNCDDGLFTASANTLQTTFDEVVTAEQVRSYKPRLRHFAEFVNRTGATPDRWVHVGASWTSDMVPAYRLGVPSVWIERTSTGYDASLATVATSGLRDTARLLSTVIGRQRVSGFERPWDAS